MYISFYILSINLSDTLLSTILVGGRQVSRIYKDQSIGNPVSIAVMKIVKTDEVFGVKHRGSDGIAAADMLRRFCNWQKRNNPEEPSLEHHDTALLLTRFVSERECWDI